MTEGPLTPLNFFHQEAKKPTHKKEAQSHCPKHASKKEVSADFIRDRHALGTMRPIRFTGRKKVIQEEDPNDPVKQIMKLYLQNNPKMARPER